MIQTMLIDINLKILALNVDNGQKNKGFTALAVSVIVYLNCKISLTNPFDNFLDYNLFGVSETCSVSFVFLQKKSN